MRTTTPSEAGTHPSPIALASLLSLALASTGCAPPSAWRPRAVDRSRFTALIRGGDGDVEWEVADRFRLLTQTGATEELFRRYASYYQSVRTQINDAGVLETAWNPESSGYREGYLNVRSWIIRLNAPLRGQCVWSVGASPPQTGPCRGFVVGVGDGETPIGVRQAGNPDQARTIVVHPRDVLIATLGDSYASGEGVPDIRRSSTAPARWMDERCHRSLFSGPGLAALMYAMLNPHVSVTHVTFACSGAKLGDGLLDGYIGLIPPSGAHELPPQIDALRDALVGDHRRADYLTISIGGNDVGFSDVVRTALFHKATDVERIIAERVPPGVAAIEQAERKLKERLDAIGVSAPRTRIVVTEYPNPTNLWKVPANIHAPKGELENECGSRGGNVITFVGGALAGLGLTITPEEIRVMDDGIAHPLRDAVSGMASFLGAKLIDGIDREFRVHGYCAPGLSLPNGTVRWINTVLDARVAGFSDINGAMHPNIRGQDSYARHLLEAIRESECKGDKIAADDYVRPHLCEAGCWNSGLPGYGANADDVPPGVGGD